MAELQHHLLSHVLILEQLYRSKNENLPLGSNRHETKRPLSWQNNLNASIQVECKANL